MRRSRSLCTAGAVLLERNPELREPESFIKDINTDPFAKTERVGSTAGRRQWLHMASGFLSWASQA